MGRPRLAIYVRDDPAYSETFLRVQITGLAPSLLLSGEPYATNATPDGAFYPPRTAAGLAAVAWARGVRRQGAYTVQKALTTTVLRRNRTSALLANYGFEGVKFLEVAAKLGIPLITHFHGFDAYAEHILSRHAADYPALGHNGNLVLAVSEHMRRQLVGLGVPSNAIQVVRYGADPERFQPAEESPVDAVFFGVGRFVDKKGPHLTLLAFKLARAALPKARLVLAGGGELIETVRSLAAHFDLGGSVELPGPLGPDEVAIRMRDATAFVQHSITPVLGPFTGDSEGTPVAVLEAMMSGLPIIASRHAGIPEVVPDGEAGLLFDEGDVQAMAAAMVRIATDAPLRRSLGQRARAVALQKYKHTDYVSALAGCVAGAVHSRGTAGGVARRAQPGSGEAKGC